jgi:MFS family permease
VSRRPQWLGTGRRPDGPTPTGPDTTRTGRHRSDPPGRGVSDDLAAEARVPRDDAGFAPEITPPTARPGSAGRPRHPAAVVTLSIAAASAAVLPVFLTGAVSVQLGHAVHIRATVIGLLVATFFGTAALTSASFGALAERAGALRVIATSAGVTAVAMAAIAAFGQHLPLLFAALVVAGAANGATQPAVNLYLTRGVSAARQGLAFGIKQAGIPTATLLSGLAVPLLAIRFGWQAGFAVGAGLVATVALVAATTTSRGAPTSRATPISRALSADGATTASGARGRVEPVGPGRVTPLRSGPPSAGGPDGEPVRFASATPHPPDTGQERPGDEGPDRTTPSARDEGLVAPHGTAPVLPGRAAVAVLPLAVLAAGMTFAVSASNALGTFVVPSAVAHGLAPGLAGLVSALGSTTGLATRVTMGWRADRPVRPGRPGRHPARGRQLGVVAAMLSLGTLGYLALALGGRGLLIPGVVVAYSAGWGFNGLFNLAVVRSHPATPARATGITQVGTYLGGMLGPLVFGILVDHAGYTSAWILAALLAACGALTMLAGRALLARRPL